MKSAVQPSLDAQDCGFHKRVISPGSSTASPVDGTTCSIILELNGSSNLDPNTGLILGEVISIVIGEGDSDFVSEIESCLKTMKQGEMSEFKIQDSVDAESKIDIKLTLQDFQNPKEIFEMSNTEKFDKAKHHKEKGVELFRNQNVKAAFKCFSKAVKYLIMLDKAHYLPHGYATLQCQCYLNLAACQLKSSSSADYVIANCTKALTLDQGNVKGYVRRGQAFFTKGDYSSAREDFQKALEIEPENKFAHNLLRKATNAQRDKNLL